MIPEVRWLVIGHPFLDRAFRRDDRLEGVDVEGASLKLRPPETAALVEAGC